MSREHHLGEDLAALASPPGTALELPSARRSELEAHLADCPACQAALADARRIFQVLDREPVAEPSARFDAALMERLDGIDRARRADGESGLWARLTGASGRGRVPVRPAGGLAPPITGASGRGRVPVRPAGGLAPPTGKKSLAGLALASAAAAAALFVLRATPPSPGETTASPGELAQAETLAVAADLALLREFEVVENLDLLDDLEVIEHMDEPG
jgi:hypothetical protein